MRLALLALVLALSTSARAQDDDAVLDTPHVGDGIPERVEQLEREWAEDVGTKDTAEEHEPDADAEPADAAEAATGDDPEPVKTPPAAEAPPPAKPRSALAKPLADPIGSSRAAAKSDPAAKADRASPAPSRIERRATSPEE